MKENYNQSALPIASPKKQISLNCTRQVRPSSPYPLPELFSKSKLLRINHQQIIKAVQTHAWRAKTSLPILRTLSYEVSPLVRSQDKKPIFRSEPFFHGRPNITVEENSTNAKIIQYVQQHPEVSDYELAVSVQEVKCRLSDIKTLPFSQVVYLLKEALIGFEVLVDLFGIFEPEEQMLAVNYLDHWKMWINQDYSINDKIQSKISEKQFLYKLLLICEKHCMPSSQSKSFFSMIKQCSYSSDCSFIKIIEKTNEFVSINKVYQVTKVTLTSDKMLKDKPHTGPESDRLSEIKQYLKKFSAHVYTNTKSKSSTPISTPTGYSIKSISNFVASNKLSNQLNKGVNEGVMPSSPNIKTQQLHNEQVKFNSADYGKQLKNIHLKRLTENAIKNLKIGQKIPSRTSNNKNINAFRTCNNSSPYVHSPLHNNSISSHKIPINVTAPKHRQQIKQIYKDHKTLSKLQNPTTNIKKSSTRKYSEPIVKIKSKDVLINKNTTKKDSNTNKQLPTNNIYKPANRHDSIQPSALTTPSPIKNIVSKGSQTPEIQCDNSPNNSSSTKQLRNSRQIQNREKQKTNYANLKMNDLSDSRLKYNQSVINCYQKQEQPTHSKDKNMAVSYQFPNRGHQNSINSHASQNQKQKTEQSKWKNKISGLFSDNVSIKHLKESVQIRTKEEEHFEKQYLKDIKLDKLQKFGRKVNHIVIEEDDSHHSQAHVNYSHKYAQYKSMQLIEEELEEAKSYLDEDLKNDDIVSKSIRSRLQTVQTVQTVKTNLHKDKHANIPHLNKQNSSEFDDDDAESEIPDTPKNDNGGFNFESQHYSISPNKR